MARAKTATTTATRPALKRAAPKRTTPKRTTPKRATAKARAVAAAPDRKWTTDAAEKHVMERAHGHCEVCGVAEGFQGARDGKGTWHPSASLRHHTAEQNSHFFGKGYPRVITVQLKPVWAKYRGQSCDPKYARAACQSCIAKIRKVLDDSSQFGLARAYGSLSSNSPEKSGGAAQIPFSWTDISEG